jgi:hypothetical protein
LYSLLLQLLLLKLLLHQQLKQLPLLLLLQQPQLASHSARRYWQL